MEDRLTKIVIKRIKERMAATTYKFHRHRIDEEGCSPIFASLLYG